MFRITKFGKLLQISQNNNRKNIKMKNPESHLNHLQGWQGELAATRMWKNIIIILIIIFCCYGKL